MPGGRRGLIGIESRGTTVEVGAFVTIKRRQRVAVGLRRERRDGSFLAWAQAPV
jgi:hypothetical protein